MASPVMTVRELADYLRIHPSTIYRLLKQKRIPAFKFGREWRFNRETIDRWRPRTAKNRGGANSYRGENSQWDCGPCPRDKSPNGCGASTRAANASCASIAAPPHTASPRLLRISVSFGLGTESSPKRPALIVGIEVQHHSLR